MNETYLMFKNGTVAEKFDPEVVDFLVKNGYAVFDRTVDFGKHGKVDYYKAKGAS